MGKFTKGTCWPCIDLDVRREFGIEREIGETWSFVSYNVKFRTRLNPTCEMHRFCRRALNGKELSPGDQFFRVEKPYRSTIFGDGILSLMRAI